MIDTKKFEELCARRAELEAEDRVYRSIMEFANANASRCFDERLFMDMATWRNVAKDAYEKVGKLSEEYDKIVSEIN